MEAQAVPRIVSPFDESLMRTVLQAGMSARSKGDQRPWRFIVIDDAALLASLGAEGYPALREASAAILICADANRFRESAFFPQDCAAAAQAMVAAAEDAGMAPELDRLFPRRELMAGLVEVLRLPHTLIPFALIGMGCPCRLAQRTAPAWDDAVVSWNGASTANDLAEAM